MKKIITILLGTCFAIQLNAGDKEIIKSQLYEVTVYAQGAQLYQRASYSAKPGITEVIIEGISPHIDANSLQVKATGSVIILDSKHSIYYPKPKEVSAEMLSPKTKREIKLLEDSLKLFVFDLQDIQDEIDVLTASKSILTNNGAIRGQGKVNDSINLLKQAVDYYSFKMMEINKKLLALNRRKSAKNEAKSELVERIQKLKKFQQTEENPEGEDGAPIHRITVTISAKEAVTGKMNISYLVANAGWVPMYDLRSDGLTSNINLTYKAQVFQNCELDWENVKLNISTNNPYQNKTKPTLHPWYVDYYTYKVTGRMDNKMNAPTMAKSLSYTNAATGSNDDEKAIAETSDQFVQVVRQLTSAEFKIDLPYTIKSDNEKHIVLIKVADLNANYKYYTVPKMDNSVYLVAQLSKLDELGLVPAQANIFFDGSYVGATYIDPTTMDDTLNLSLGRDPNIIVKRLLVKKESKEKIIGDKKERTMTYSIEVKNLKATGIELVVQDQIPITQNGDITIEALSLDKGELDTKTGTIEWKFYLKPKDSKTLNFGYKIKHNKDMNVEVW